MAGRFDHFVNAVREAVVGPAGVIPEADRRAARDGGSLPGARGAFLEKLRANAWKITDEDVAALRRAGLGDEEIYDLTVAGAVGAGLKRLDCGLAALAAAKARKP